MWIFGMFSLQNAFLGCISPFVVLLSGCHWVPHFVLCMYFWSQLWSRWVLHLVRAGNRPGRRWVWQLIASNMRRLTQADLCRSSTSSDCGCMGVSPCQYNARRGSFTHRSILTTRPSSWIGPGAASSWTGTMVSVYCQKYPSSQYCLCNLI